MMLVVHLGEGGSDRTGDRFCDLCLVSHEKSSGRAKDEDGRRRTDVRSKQKHLDPDGSRTKMSPTDRRGLIPLRYDGKTEGDKEVR